MRMNLHLARIFYAVARTGSFSRGAESLHISQSAASKAVRELEAQLDLPLIERGGPKGKQGRGLRLTEGGQVLFEHARGIFALEAAALDDLRARSGLSRGRLVIGASTTVAGYWLPPYVAQFSARFPEIEVQVVVGNTQVIGQGLLDCRMDVAVVEGALNDPGIASMPWREEDLVLVAASGSALASGAKADAEELGAQRWLMREPGSGTREVSQRLLHERGIAPANMLEMGSNEAIARAVAHGAGIALLPLVVVQDLLALGKLAAVTGQGACRRPLFRLQRSQRPLSPPAQAFSALLREDPVDIARNHE